MKRVVLASLLFALPARADSSMWEKAKTPTPKGVLTPDELHRLVAVRLHEQGKKRATDPFTGALSFTALDDAAKKLVEYKAEVSPDPRLRYDLGFVYAKLPNRCAQAVVVLEDALKFSREHPFAADGAFELAICYSKLGKHADEERVYLTALDVTDRRSHKAIIYSNLSEARMAQGKLAEGIEAAEAAIELEPDFASPRYNLAILRDRSGDAFGALDAAKHAVAMDPEGEYLAGEGVFFEPPYERHWYDALRDLALADQAIGDERFERLLAAQLAYQKWLDDSNPNDRYRARCAEDITRIEKMLKLKPSPAAKKKK